MMDLDESFIIEGMDSSFSVTNTQSTPLKMQHECGICGKSFGNKFILKKHLLQHSSADEQPEEPLDLSLIVDEVAISPIRHSDFIDTSTNDKAELHISPTKDKERHKFSCEICQFSTRFKHNLKRHLKIHLSPKSAPKLKCDRREKQINFEKNLTCDICDYKTPSRFNLTRHVNKLHVNKVHSEEIQRQTFICEICGKILHSRFAQKLHIKTLHAKIFKYKCPTCTKGYNQIRPFRAHLASHHEILKEKCDLCSATFNNQISLAEHTQAVHENRAFGCSFPSCSAAYSSARPLRDHVKAEHNKDRVPCDKCPRTFKWRSSLKYHKATAH